MFLGEYQHSVDAKGRVVLPSKFRDELAAGCVITKGQERCLYVFTTERFSDEVDRIKSLPRTERKFRDYARSFFAGASDQTLDRQGRIQIPATLRSYAGLGKDVAIVGVGERLEVWDAGSWRAFTESSDENYAELEEALSEHGI